MGRKIINRSIVILSIVISSFAGMKTDTLTVTGGANLNRVKMDSVSIINRLDSGKATAFNADRLYFGSQTGTKIKNDSLLIKSFNGTTPKYWRVKIDSTGAITTDSAGVN